MLVIGSPSSTHKRRQKAEVTNKHVLKGQKLDAASVLTLQTGQVILHCLSNKLSSVSQPEILEVNSM